ncbi:MAG: hypothetical protein Q9213_005970 [Squamulea squamosa]
MSPISILFSTDDRPKFNWFENHKALKTTELNELVILCRGATAAFSAELTRRSKQSTDRSLEAQLRKLQQIAETIREHGVQDVQEAAKLVKPKWYSKFGPEWVQESYNALRDPTSACVEPNASRLARHYIWLVSRILGWAHALLILFTFGFDFLRKLNELHRAELLTYLVKHCNGLLCIDANPRGQKRKHDGTEDVTRLPLPDTAGCSEISSRSVTATPISNTDAVSNEQRSLMISDVSSHLRRGRISISSMLNDAPTSAVTDNPTNLVLGFHEIEHESTHAANLLRLLYFLDDFQIARLLLSASVFGNDSWKLEALEAVRSILEVPAQPYLQAWLNCRECHLASLNIKHEVYDPALWQVDSCDQDNRVNAYRGKWFLAYAMYKQRCNDLDGALAIADRYRPLDDAHPSTMEALVLADKQFVRGRIYRYKGGFTTAVTLLQPYNKNLDLVHSGQRTAQLACVLCEKGQFDLAEDMLRHELVGLKDQGLEDVSFGRDIRLSLAETLLMKGLLREAEEHFRALEELFESCDVNLATGIGRLRLWLGLARISHRQGLWVDATNRWKSALKAAEDCGWAAGFAAMVIHNSLGHIHWVQFRAHLKQASDIFPRERREFWFTGLAGWLDNLEADLGLYFAQG